jgi:predicted kinase
MTKLLILQGLPASGKSTFARSLVADSAGLAVRINNDELSEMLFGSTYTGNKSSARLLERLRFSIARSAIDNGYELVIVDNTNLNPRTLRAWIDFAETVGVEWELNATFLEVPLEVCLARNAGRANPVPESVIRSMAEQHAKSVEVGNALAEVLH